MLIIEPNQLSRGCITYENETKYDGSIIDAVPHGKGLLKITEGHGYAGTFFYGKPIGYGVWTNSDGKTAHGKWNELGEFEVIGEWK